MQGQQHIVKTRRLRLDSMNVVALRMLSGDRAKYLALIFAIAFSSFLITQQVTIFAGVMNRTRSQILDTTDCDMWIMDPTTQYVDEIYPLNDFDLYRVRSVPGVLWATPFYKGQAVAKTTEGNFRVTILLGVDDATLAGSPTADKMIMGSVDDLRQPDAIIIDRAGYRTYFPNAPLELGRTMELNDHRARIVGIVEASAPYQTFPVMYTRYSQALSYVGRQRRMLSFVLAKRDPKVSATEVTGRIHAATGLKALTSEQFGLATITFYLRHTGIVVSFGLTAAIAILVGTVVAGQTFYLFTVENLKQFGALKAIGVTNRRIVGMILTQAFAVAAIGYAIGMGIVSIFFRTFDHQDATRGIDVPWQAMAGTALIVMVIVVLASLVSIRKVLVLEPAVVFRG
jgi:putative ABC transport system permease protein